VPHGCPGAMGEAWPGETADAAFAVGGCLTVYRVRLSIVIVAIS
jgi:hypothetical protein